MAQEKVNNKKRPDQLSPEGARDLINQLLEEGGIFPAIQILSEMKIIRESNELRDKLAKEKEVYKYMMQYFLQGNPDNDRERVIRQIAEGLRTIADGAVRESRVAESPDLYSSTLRMNRLKQISVAELLGEYKTACAERELAEAAEADTKEIQRRLDFIAEDFFNYVFTLFDSGNEARQVASIVIDPANPDELRRLITSALAVSLTQYYSRPSLIALLDIYENLEEEDSISSRALLGIMLSAALHPERIKDDSEIMTRISLWEDSISTYMRLREAIRTIVGTRDTERVSAKMKDEVIPELMKLQPEFIKRLRDASQDNESIMLEDNPEWEELMNKSGLAKKMEELQSMQNDGADMMMVAFSSLKQFPFFNKAVHWFKPFDVRSTGLDLNDEDAKIMNNLSTFGSQVCDSDLYSLALALKHMPAQQRQMVVSNFSEQLDQLSKIQKEGALYSSTPGFKAELMKVTKDLYRFFKLFRNKMNLIDPFNHAFNFRSLPAIGDMMANDEVLKLIGEFYFTRGYYNEALPLLESLVEDDADSPHLWEKIGFARQMLRNYAGARDAYEKAEFLKAPSQWLIRRLAQVNKRLGNHDKAIKYYDKALAVDPDNVELLLAIGHSSLENGDIAGALKAYYHANYISKDEIRILRSLAWAELLKGNFAKSIDLYRCILEDTPAEADYLNAGHANAVAGNFNRAVELYKVAAKGNIEEFKLAFIADLPTLEKLGVDHMKSTLLLDATQMALQ